MAIIKKFHALLLSSLLCTSVQAAGIIGSKHDLSGGDFSQICIQCHARYIANPDPSLPIWSIRNPSPYDTYTLYTSPTATQIYPAQPSGVSLVCLSCHDGTLGSSQLSVSGGPDLRNDHPVSMDYPVGNSNYRTPSGGVKLFEGKVECPSCHSVHDPTNTPFLRISNSGSAMCLTCHTK